MEIQKEKDILFELCDKGEVYFIHEEHLIYIEVSLENIYSYSTYPLCDISSEVGECSDDGGVCNGTPLDAIRMSIA